MAKGWGCCDGYDQFWDTYRSSPYRWPWGRICHPTHTGPLTYMFTIATMIQSKVLHERNSANGGSGKRKFFFRLEWQQGLGSLPSATGGGLRRQPSQRAAVEALVNEFIIGRPRFELIRPTGQGMDPPFRRMKPPNGAVVEMRTEKTRTFGFFHKANEFVAVLLVHVDALKKRPDEPTKDLENGRYLHCANQVQALIAHMSKTEVDLSDVENLVTD
jgi:hypothetical protein